MAFQRCVPLTECPMSACLMVTVTITKLVGGVFLGSLTSTVHAFPTTMEHTDRTQVQVVYWWDIMTRFQRRYAGTGIL